MNSMLAVEFRSRLSQQFCVTLPATLIFDYPSISAVHHFLTASTPKRTISPQGQTAPTAIDLQSLMEKVGIPCIDGDQSLME
jgi:hypothetical protein